VTIERLRAALAHPNVAAFLRVVRTGESSQGDDAYFWLFGSTPSRPKLFESAADHPRVRTYETHDGQFIRNGKIDYTTAAGAYQITETTWNGLVRRYGFADFSPATQDLAAVALIEGRGALEDVIAGRLKQALWKCRREWASLPDADYGQPTIALDKAVQTYRAYGGGQIAASAAAAPAPIPTQPSAVPAPPEAAYPFPPSPAPAPISEPQPEPTMPATIPAIIFGELLRTLPSLIRLGGSQGSENTERNARLAEAVVPIVQASVGARDPVEALDMVKTDPVAAQKADAAVKANYYDLADLWKAHELDESSRIAASDRVLEFGKATGGRWIWFLGAVIGLVVFCSYAITAAVLFSERTSFSDETKALLLGQIVIQGFIMAMTFMLGSNLQNRIDATRAERRSSDR
jgi:muramidase (phage lysozyme)